MMVLSNACFARCNLYKATPNFSSRPSDYIYYSGIVKRSVQGSEIVTR